MEFAALYRNEHLSESDLVLIAEDEAEPKHGTLPELCRVEPAHRVVLDF